MNIEVVKSVIGFILLVCLMLVSVPFEKRYSSFITQLSQNHAARFISGIMLLLLASYDIILASLAFIIIIMWISDIQLLTQFRFNKLIKQ